jgi:hypothetical protein
VTVGLDKRATYSTADRKAQFDAASRIQTMFGEMSKLTDRIDGARAACDARSKALPESDPLQAKLRAASAKLDDAKKLVVATKEGGAITGEERIREHLDLLYGAVNGWEGRPTRYQLERIDVLKHELADAEKAFETIATSDLKALEAPLREKKLEAIPTTATADADDVLDPADPKVAAAARCLMSRGLACDDAVKAAAAAAAREQD